MAKIQLRAFIFDHVSSTHKSKNNDWSRLIREQARDCTAGSVFFSLYIFHGFSTEDYILLGFERGAGYFRTSS